MCAILKVLVTGGAGFIGSHVAARLVAHGHDVSILDNFATGRRENVPEGVETVEGDIRSIERVRDAAGGREVVLHLAALPSVPRSFQDPLTTHETNVTGSLNVLLAARDTGVRRVVLASSSSVYGVRPELPARESAVPQPASPYATGKLAAEGYCRSFASAHGLETLVLRYFNVYGPRQDPRSNYAAVIPTFIDAMREGRAPTIYGDGQQSRDFTFVEDVADANLAALTATAGTGEVFNIARGERMTVRAVFDVLRELLGADVEAIQGDPRVGDAHHSLADVSRARETLDWAPRVNLRDGLRRTAQA